MDGEKIMIPGIPAKTIKLTSEDIVFVENEQHALLVYKMDGEEPSLRVVGEKNILAIRDLLNEAYPVSNTKGGCTCGTSSQTRHSEA
ncbi:hypothetical protein D3C75_730910 [compost metagenome]